MGLKVNFSKTEAASAPREIPPSGEYRCTIYDIELREVKPGSENAGKPYWNVQFVIQDGPYASNRLNSNIMLFAGKDGTLSALAQFLKALGYQITEGEFELPLAEELVGKHLNVQGRKVPAGKDPRSGREYGEHFRVTGYKPASRTVKSSSADKLP